MDTILTWIGKFLQLLDKWTNSYILAIFLFAVIIEVLMLPFGILQQKNSIKQARLRPKEMAIRKKYDGRNDRTTQQKVAQEVQELYQKENFNQFAGCLPTLLTIPILLILYYVSATIIIVRDASTNASVARPSMSITYERSV